MPEAPERDPYGPYVCRTRDEWAKLTDSLPVHVTEEMVRAARSSQDTIDLDQVRQVYAPLTELISLYVRHTGGLYETTHDFLDLAEHRTPFVIGVAGSVSVGKSTTSRLLRELLSQTPGHPHVDLITTDGFLYPNRVLADRGLMQRKGFPESYDHRALLQFMAAVKAGEAEVRAPVYSHVSYDIVPNESLVVRRPDIVIVEGLNVLQTGDGGGDRARMFVSDYFDFGIYVDAEERDVEQWFTDRFLALRDTVFRDPHSYFHRFAELSHEEAVAMAARVWTEINGLNLRENILPTRERATLILEKGADHRVRQVRLRKL